MAPADPRGLASAVTRILTNPQEARRLGDNGLGRVRGRFTIGAMVREYEAIYEAVRGGSALPGASPRAAIADGVAG